jgi:hypothetical protein
MSTIIPTRIFQTIAVLLLTSLLLSVAGAAVPKVALPTVEMLPYNRSDDINERNVPFLAWFEDLSKQGYVEEEILISGTANQYDYVDEVGQSPEPQPNGLKRDYTTRVLIRHPVDPADFNGVVYMEILNATARADGSPMWDFTWPSIIDDGAAYVGVTYSDLAVIFLRDRWGKPGTGAADDPRPASAEFRDNSRYATLLLPKRWYIWDVLNQTAALLKADTDANNPMQGFAVDTIITTGYSQSARYVNTFNNSFYPSYSAQCTDDAEAVGAAVGDVCDPLVNGYIVAAGGANASKLNGEKVHAKGDLRNCNNALNRETECIEGVEDPVPADPYAHQLAKVVHFTTESDVVNARIRQTMVDQPLLRTYEAAGTSHVDYWSSVQAQYVSEYQYGTTPTGDFRGPCLLPFNPIRTGIPLSAIQHRLALWIQQDELPPPSQYMVWEGDFDLWVGGKRQVNWVRDNGNNIADEGDDGVGDGNAVRGVRPPRLNVPLGQYYGSNFVDDPASEWRVLCTGIFGGFDAYDATELEARYTNRWTLVILTWWNMWMSYLDGFLLAVDAPTIMDEAKAFTGLPD